MSVHLLFIGGEWLETAARREIRVPYDGSLIGEMCEAGAEVFERAVIAAQAGARVMAAMAPFQRAELLQRTAALLRRDSEDVARTIAMETGKPIRDARGEVSRACGTLDESAVVARELRGEVVPMEAHPSGAGRMAITVREPLGIIGAITPFNFPLNLSLHKIAPALAAGNAVLHKPSEQTPLSAVKIAKLLEEAGAPAGAYNLVAGDETVGRMIVQDPRIAMVTFTGSVPVGKEIRATAGLKKVTLELGGNSAVIIEPDADIALAVARAATGAFAVSGQACISLQRVYVHADRFDAFVDALKVAAGKLVIGHPLDDATEISSLISEEAAQRVEQWIAEAVAAGARRITGGVRHGAIVTPCVLTDVPVGVRISCQEAFGPVVLVAPYADLDEAIDRANSTSYGLQAGIFTNNLPRAFHAARRLAAGGVMINDIPTFRADHMPYGGVKESGLGREGPRYAAEEMTELKLVCWKL